MNLPAFFLQYFPNSNRKGKGKILFNLCTKILGTQTINDVSISKQKNPLFFLREVYTIIIVHTLQRQNAENLKQIFPEKEYRGLSPNFHIHVSVSELYIPTMVCLFCWRKCVDRCWEFINRSQAHECGNWGLGCAIPRKEIHKRNCHCSVQPSYVS